MAPITTAEVEALAARFEALLDQWKGGTTLLSSSTAMIAHPAYQAIIALGPPAVPLILRDLEREPAHWFEALQAITGEDPVPRQDWGKIQAMRAAWLAWGRNRGLSIEHATPDAVASGEYGEVAAILGRAPLAK